MKRDMRRKDRQLAEAEIQKILADNKYGVLSIVTKEGYPYGVPLSYAYEDGKIYFHKSNESGLLKDNIAGEVKACFTVVGETELLPEKFSTRYESVIAFGTIKESEDKVAVLVKLVKSLSPDFIEKGQKYAEASLHEVAVYEFEVEQVTGKARKNK